MRRHFDGERKRVHPTVLYLCDGKVSRCSGSFYCLTQCKHTTHIEHAKNFTKAKEPDWSGAEYWEDDIEDGETDDN